jgi:hypothetical protein
MHNVYFFLCFSIISFYMLVTIWLFVRIYWFRFSSHSQYKIYDNVLVSSILYLLQTPDTTEKSPQPGPSSRPDIVPEVKSFRCRRCLQSFSDRRGLYLHGMREHYQTGGGTLQSRPWTNGESPWERDDGVRLKQVYEANEPLILENHEETSVMGKNVHLSKIVF